MKNIIEAINAQIKEEQRKQEKSIGHRDNLYIESLKREIDLHQSKLLIAEAMYYGDSFDTGQKKRKKKNKRKQDELYDFAKSTAKSAEFLEEFAKAYLDVISK